MGCYLDPRRVAAADYAFFGRYLSSMTSDQCMIEPLGLLRNCGRSTQRLCVTSLPRFGKCSPEAGRCVGSFLVSPSRDEKVFPSHSLPHQGMPTNNEHFTGHSE